MRIRMPLNRGRNGLARGERLQIMLAPHELEAVDDFRFKNRMPSRAAAVRELFRLGLASINLVKQDGRKSADFGVLETGKERVNSSEAR